MKKFTLFIASLFLALGAMAQTFVMPETGKYYKIKGDNSKYPWLMGVQKSGGSGVAVSANEADAAIFEKTANGLKVHGTNTYLYYSGSGDVSIGNSESTVTIGDYNKSTDAGTKYSIKVAGAYMYNNNTDQQVHTSGTFITNIERYWGFIEVNMGEQPALISRTGWGVTASSQETSGDPGQATNAIDGDNTTFWHTVYANNYPHWIEFDMTKAYTIYSFDYVSRFDNTNSNGNILKYKLYISNSAMNGNYENATLAASGTFVYGQGVNHLIQLETPVVGRYVALVAESGTKGNWSGNAAKAAANCTEFYVYGIEKPAETNEEEKAALAEAIAQAEALLALITVGDGVGEYSGGGYTKEELVSFLDSAKGFYKSIDASTPVETIEAYIEVINGTMALYTLNMPEAGKYYRFKGNSGNYIDASSIYNNATAKVGQMSMKSDKTCNLAGTIFYLDKNGKLLNYHTGTYITATREIANVGVAGNTWTISASSIVGKYKIKSNDGNWLHDNSGNRADRCDKDPDGHSETHSWVIEEVVELPVTITSAGYATFYAPVAVNIPEGVKAYTVSINEGGWADLEEIYLSFSPGTGVVLAAEEGTYYLPISEDNTVFEGNALRGTVEATYITDDAYVLGYINVAEEGQPEKKEVGFYTATKNQQDGASWKNNSHKAYLPKAVGMNAASYSFRFGEDTTGIENVEVENTVKVIYDLTGRRVESITAPGIYIVGGKKILVK